MKKQCKHDLVSNEKVFIPVINAFCKCGSTFRMLEKLDFARNIKVCNAPIALLYILPSLLLNFCVYISKGRKLLDRQLGNSGVRQ